MSEPVGKQVSLPAIYRVFFLIGLMSFGGGLVTWIQREVVVVRRWMSDAEFLSGLGLVQVLPGVNSTNSSIFVGQRLRGFPGAAVAMIALLSGPFVAVLVLAGSYDWLRTVPGFSYAMEGVAAVAMGLLARLGLHGASRAARSIPQGLALVATIVCVGILQWPLLGVVAIVAPLSIAANWPRGALDA